MRSDNMAQLYFNYAKEHMSANIGNPAIETEEPVSDHANVQVHDGILE
jgi:hypothetical protein